jgi:hypothetical protein
MDGRVQDAVDSRGRTERGASSLQRLAELAHRAGMAEIAGLFYTDMMTLATRSPLLWLVDLLRPGASMRRSARRSATEYLERLLAANTARVRADFDERVLESRRRLEAEVRALLREVHAAAERALVGMRSRLAAGEEAVQSELRRIEALRASVLEVGARRAGAAAGGSRAD